MFNEEVLPRPVDAPQRRVLDTLGIEELNAYIGWLEEEIARVREEIGRKEAAGSAAESFFSS